MPEVQIRTISRRTPFTKAMPELPGLAVDVIADLRRHRRSLLVYHLFFTALAAAVLVPAAGWTLTALLAWTGRPVVTDGEIFGFMTSPPGVLWALASTTLALLVITLQQAGMMLIAAAGKRAPYHIAAIALWHVTWRLPHLAALTVMRVAAHVLVTAPFLAAIGLLYALALGDYNPYYVRTSQPPGLWLFVAAAAPFAAGLLACNAALYLRWVLALPALMLERLAPRAALRRSAALTRGRHWPIAGVILGMVVVIVGLPVAASEVMTIAGAATLGWLPQRVAVLIPATLVFLTLYILVNITVTFLGTGVNSLLIAALHHRAARVEARFARAIVPRRTRALAWGVDLLLVFFAVSQAGAVLKSFEFIDEVQITAHRGSSRLAPENTISAIEQAIDVGADYIEVDVRQTADGAVVVLHDSNLRRTGGIDREIWEMSLDAAREVDVGSWFSDEFADERIPTLQEAIDTVRGRAHLYIEIKPHRQTPRLTDAVVELLQENDLIEGTVIASMNPTVLSEVERLEPALRTVRFLRYVIGTLDRDSFDALGLRADRVTPRDVAAAHDNGHELHVWTVNDRDTMARLIDMGVDGIITDRPAALERLLTQRRELTRAELILVKVRNWLEY